MAYSECHTSEADVGMKYYLTSTEGTGGRIKVLPEDFVVKEISNGPEPKDNGKFTIAEITTRNWETNRLIRMLSRNLGISREKIGFAGTKDKRAVTTQLMSFEVPEEKIASLSISDINFGKIYRAGRPLQIGDLIGNYFEIRVRECEKPTDQVKTAYDEVSKLGGFPNYFGVQRFGVMRPITHKVGEKLVRGDIEGAVRTYVHGYSPLEEEEIREARIRLAESKDWSKDLNSIPEKMSFEKIMVSHMVENPDDWKGAIAAMPRNLQMMFVHAYQSYLFNKMLSARMEKGLPLNKPVEGDVLIPLDASGIPLHENPVTITAKNVDLAARQVKMKKAYITSSLFGSDSTFAEGEMGEIERNVIESEGLKAEDFIIPGLDHCSSKGSRREVVCPVKDLSFRNEDDGYTVSFSLPKGNYATCLMREFMKSDMDKY